ncbi:MAG: ABC transporter permease [Haloferacaceae archaeon]
MATEDSTPRHVTREPDDRLERKPETDDGTEARVGWSYLISKITSDSSARIGLTIIGFTTLLALFAFVDSQLLDYAIAERFWVSPVRDQPDTPILLPPAGLENEFGTGVWQHPLGTDQRGRDILLRLIYGTRIAIQVGIIATGLGMAGGTVVGAVAGYYGGWVDDVLMRIVETIYAIPFLILVIAFMVAFGRDINFAIIGVSIASVPVFARLIRSEVVSVREEEYIEAARAIGARDWEIIYHHVIPNSFAPVVVQGTLQVGINILIVAGLSFLGFGAQPPTPSWGQMLSQSRGFMIPNPWFSIWPGLAILFTVMGFNLFGDGLRDSLDPRLRDQ